MVCCRGYLYLLCCKSGKAHPAKPEKVVVKGKPAMNPGRFLLRNNIQRRAEIKVVCFHIRMFHYVVAQIFRLCEHKLAI